VSDGELFTRLFYYGTVQMRMGAEDFWLTPLGLFMDLWECHRQFIGASKPRREMSIDEIIPGGI
jgi:hypothetical protein